MDRLAHLAPPRLLEPGARLQWDAATQRALAIVDDAPGGGGRGSDAPRTLLQTLDRCGSAAGRRWLRAALLAPLLDQPRIETRLDRIAALRERGALRRAVRAAAREAPDLERLLARLAAGLARPAELAALARGLLAAAALAERIGAEIGAAGEVGEDGQAASGNVAASGPEGPWRRWRNGWGRRRRRRARWPRRCSSSPKRPTAAACCAPGLTRRSTPPRRGARPAARGWPSWRRRCAPRAGWLG